uniref:Uncharacterized protein n=1 Tax=Rhipicephalus appendiculatus TaxID=34631 RepID=A0A131YFL7_RHIAP
MAKRQKETAVRKQCEKKSPCTAYIIFLKQLHSDENTNRPTSSYLQRCIRVFKQEKNRRTFRPTAQIARTKSYSANTELVHAVWTGQTPDACTGTRFGNSLFSKKMHWILLEGA